MASPLHYSEHTRIALAGCSLYAGTLIYKHTDAGDLTALRGHGPLMEWNKGLHVSLHASEPHKSLKGFQCSAMGQRAPEAGSKLCISRFNTTVCPRLELLKMTNYIRVLVDG
jgi:hypothetical protein